MISTPIPNDAIKSKIDLLRERIPKGNTNILNSNIDLDTYL